MRFLAFLNGFTISNWPQNFALLRRIALNALERESSFRRSIRQKSQLDYRLINMSFGVGSNLPKNSYKTKSDRWHR